ncbi:hypothetical protein PQ125_002643 [Salmonella enterica]|nr:hypothetical protein [Salmonella enterica]
MSQVSTKEFCDALRQKAGSIAQGEPLQIFTGWILQNIDPEDAAKLTPSYIRSILVRTPEIKAKGSVSIKKRTSEDKGEFFEITLNENKKRRVITSDDLPAIKAAERNKMAKDIIAVMPNIADLEDEQLQGAAIAVKRYQDLIKAMVVEE